MFGGNTAKDHTPPWSLFGDFAEPYLPESKQGSGHVFTPPVSGVSVPNVRSPSYHLVHDAFGGGMSGLPEFGLHKDSTGDALAAHPFQRFLPSNNELADDDDVGGIADAYSCDEFRMYDFKVRRCVRGRSHDWTECPYAHPGEKARRRDPRKFHYSGAACPDFRKGSCKRGDACEFAHGVFVSWLHPARYRTQPCKDGTACRRRVCFFAHTPEQLRLMSQSHATVARSSPRHLGNGNSLCVDDAYDASSLRQALATGLDQLDASAAYLSVNLSLNSSPTSTLVCLDAVSPPVLSPSTSPPLSPANMAVVGNPVTNNYVCAFSPRRNTNTMWDVVASIGNLQIDKPKTSMTPWVGASSGQFVHSPRGPSTLRPAFSSPPASPTGWSPASGIWGFGSSASCGAGLGMEDEYKGEPPLERVESGRDVRASMFARLRNQNSLDRPETTPDFGWVSELVK